MTEGQWPVTGDPGIIVNIRGCGGAGKSTLVRRYIEASALPTRVAAGKTLGYVMGNGVQVIGAYYPSAIGAEGKTDDALIRLVDERAQVGHVLLEGKLLSGGTKLGLRWARQYGQRITFAFLQPPYEVCVARLHARRALKNSAKVISKKSWAKHRSQWGCLKSHYQQFTAAGGRCVWLPWEDPLPVLCALFVTGSR